MNIVKEKVAKKLLKLSCFLKSYLKVGDENKTIFSYQLEHTLFSTGEVVTIQQKGTGFSLSLHFGGNKEYLMVKSFTLEDNKNLGYQSLSLYDAAIIEIVLQGLDLIFFLANHKKKQEVQFILPREEFDHLDSFNSFFHSIDFPGSQVSFILTTSREDYQIFDQQAKVMRTKFHKALWIRQKEDIFLRTYLQHPNKEEFYLPSGCQPKGERLFYRDNVVAFSSHNKIMGLEKVL